MRQEVRDMLSLVPVLSRSVGQVAGHNPIRVSCVLGRNGYGGGSSLDLG